MSGLETTLLEKIRIKHEEIERLEQLVMKELTKEELSPVEKLSQDHRLRSMTKSIILKTEQLVKTYEEKKDEIAQPLGDETEVWNAFSNRIKEIHEYHEKHPSGPLLVDCEELLVDDDCGASIEAKVEKLCKLLDEFVIEEMEEDKPMGWDGKPIPYWLNRLGLGHEYKCEICKNHSYWGKKAFERHFQECEHQWTLESFGIQDRENKLNGITWIEEAKQVWKSQGGQWLENESLNIITKDKEKDAKLELSDSDHALYLKMLKEYEVSLLTPCSDYKYGYDDDIETEDEEEEDTSPPLSLEMHQFTYSLPEGMTSKELDIIKLAAEFRARYGRCFLAGFKERMGNDPYFEFMTKKKPTERSRGYLFSKFTDAYLEVLDTPPLEDLRNNAADMETILENCYHRLQWERFQMESPVKRARETTERAKLLRRLQKTTLKHLPEEEFLLAL